MKKGIVFIGITLLLWSCGKDTQNSLIGEELKNKNTVDDQTIQKSKLIQSDFEKDLDVFLQTSLTGTLD